MPAREPTPLEVHKALADDTRFRLYRHLGLSGRPVPIRELAARLSLHPNTLRPHLRRLEEAGLVRREVRRAGVGRPQTLYSAVERGAPVEGEYRLLAQILAGLVAGARGRERAAELARQWGEYLAIRGGPRPGTRARHGLAVLQEAMASAGFDPRFHRGKRGRVQITLRDCPFRDLLEDHRDLVCAVHRGLVEGMLGALKPPLSLAAFEPLVERGTCRIAATGGRAGRRAQVAGPSVR
jgi:predicted ArsR family transcriptional regulator